MIKIQNVLHNSLQDIKTQDAVVRNLEIIGEAAKNVSNKLVIGY